MYKTGTLPTELSLYELGRFYAPASTIFPTVDVLIGTTSTKTLCGYTMLSVRLELTISVKALDFKSNVYTNSTTIACAAVSSWASCFYRTPSPLYLSSGHLTVISNVHLPIDCTAYSLYNSYIAYFSTPARRRT